MTCTVGLWYSFILFCMSRNVCFYSCCLVLLYDHITTTVVLTPVFLVYVLVSLHGDYGKLLEL